MKKHIIKLGCPQLLVWLLFSCLLLSCGEMRFYQVSGEHCNIVSQWNRTGCQVSVSDMNITINAYGGKKHDLSLTIAIEYLGSKDNLEFDPNTIVIITNEQDRQGQTNKTNGSNSKQSKPVRIVPHHTTALSKKFEDVAIPTNQKIRIDLGEILTQDSPSIDLGQVEIDFSKYFVMRYM